MFTRLTLAALMVAAVPAYAADGRRAAPLPTRTTINVSVFGNDPCPKGVGDEIIVCARLPEAERYRIPPGVRRSKFDRKDQSWVARVRDIEETGRDSRPNSCSANGSGGQTGCFDKFMREARADRDADAQGVP